MSYQDLPMEIKNNIYFKTSEYMDEIDDNSIQAIITSPPYWNLKNYDHPNQIGYGETYDEYHERLDKIWLECRRVLNNKGTMWIVIDKLWRNRKVLHIPLHIAQHCKRIGFFLKDIIIWNKPTSIAGMNNRNLVNKHETILFFSKSKNNYKINLKNIARVKPDFTNEGELTDFWRFVVKAGSIRKTPDHKAPYPTELIERIIKISTEKGDVVLDPFLGSGTTGSVAYRLSRNFIGYEINAEFSKEIAKQFYTVIKNMRAQTPKLDSFLAK